MVKGVSVIICCFNSEKKIASTISHILDQKVNANLAVEIIIVDNASTDDTQKLVSLLLRESNSLFRYSVLYEPKAGLRNARIKGILNASYNYIIFCDDDNWLEENYVQEVYKNFETDINIGMLGGQGFPVFEGEEPWWFKDFYQSYAVGKQAPYNQYVHAVFGAGMCIRKDYYLQIERKFGELILNGRNGSKLSAGEDSEICYRFILSGYKIFYSESLKFHHYLNKERLTWPYFKELHIGFSKSYVTLTAYELVVLKINIKQNYWLKESLFHLIRVLKYSIIYMPQLIKNEGKIEIIRLTNWWIIFLDFLQMNINFNTLFTNIKSKSK